MLNLLILFYHKCKIDRDFQERKMSSFSKKIIHLIVILCTFSGINCWNDSEEQEQLSKLIHSFNQSMSIRNELLGINKTYYDIVETNHMELLGRPEPDLRPIIDSFLKNLQEIQTKLKDFHKRFHWLREKMMLKSINRRFNCLEYEDEIIALNDSITMVIDQLTPYRIKNAALPSSGFDSQILNQKLFKFKEDYPTYSDMEIIRREFITLDKKIKIFLEDPTKQSQLIEFLENSFQHSERINQELDRIRQETFVQARTRAQHIPVIIDYNLVFISRMHRDVWNISRMYLDKIKSGADLSSASQTIRLENLGLMLAIILMIITNSCI